MNTEQMEDNYNDLARILDDMIPEDWSEMSGSCYCDLKCQGWCILYDRL